MKAVRIAQGLTMQQVADAAGLSKGYLSRLERDAVSPTVSTLMVLCHTLRIEASDVLSEEVTEIVSKGQIVVGTSSRQGINHSLLTPSTTKSVTVTHTELEPGASAGEDLYPMFCDTQTAYVLSGKVEILFSNRKVNLTAGQAITFAGREPHSYRNPDEDQRADVIWVLVPAVGR
ncbi:helix-turn-helix domain-containing protein [Paenarthrobacter sp. YJN-5]|uniref:helix-turn-helix domain-containing protein n=1 Tax=Paenarthrobacter sp. YJN-5 TaxID=2735316 RepID=UPI001D0CBEDE|nr:helix-turn-helix domain-containing protein [Paenarthrobacter sp. YJN-5]